jgi:hypothetical protein
VYGKSGSVRQPELPAARVRVAGGRVARRRPRQAHEVMPRLAVQGPAPQAVAVDEAVVDLS